MGRLDSVIFQGVFQSTARQRTRHSIAASPVLIIRNLEPRGGIQIFAANGSSIGELPTGFCPPSASLDQIDSAQSAQQPEARWPVFSIE
jgi:hypothetical protein